MRSQSFVCVFMMASTAVLAAPSDDADYMLSTGSNTDYGFDIRVERQHQEFDGVSADIDTVSLQPWLQMENWSVSLDVPWQRAEGEYFVVDGAQPTVKNICQVPSGFLQRYPRLAQYASATCSAAAPANTGSREESGLGDVTAFTHYSQMLDAGGIWLGSIGGGYKADSGDVDLGLGSGTREIMLQGVLGASYGKFSANAVAGYAWIVGGEAEEGTDDYAYASLDLSIKPLQWLVLGAGWDFEQSYVPEGEDVKSLRGYATFHPLKSLRLQVYVKDYGDTLGYPDEEYGGSAVLSF